MSKGKTFLQIGVAAFMALMAGGIALYWMASVRTAEKPAVAPETSPVVVASRILSPGTKIAPGMLKTVPYLKESVPDQSFSDLKELDGRVLVAPLSQGEPVTRAKLADNAIAMGGVSALIDPGHRAVSVMGNKVMGLAGFVRPGNRVDVLVTMDNDGKKGHGAEHPHPFSKIVLENILVLATGEKLDAGEDGKAAPVDVYTLEVTPEESERLALAASKGMLNFALRSTLDDSKVLTSGADVPQTLSALSPARKVVHGRKLMQVEIITGSARKKLSF
ncbi:Flp pilus assembly protein CpaB [Desulfovibrio sp. X2]|uniref:Flp pilus assembly protein CpaB n=1 Tax=Desulfovibrio sp. X2 TaxID=941449 RepID=UPI00035870AB|nr:Flp pilus assembly protein CpaB [Desulfovibrio sp. X2]EPR44149.1 Flp pilus assembly protein CpaB [Desulfovibrio sp. X2]